MTADPIRGTTWWCRARLWLGIVGRVWDRNPDGVIRLGPVTAWQMARSVHP